ncbi:MAG: ROK family protein [Gammaproteobacteria bacterium]|nr:ROK family protein [Gammaproteobacteria bacterium]
MIGAVEAGGSKFQCALVRGDGQVLADRRIPTTDPGETLARVLGFFAEAQHRLGAARAFGIGTFGPVDLDPGSPTYGRLLTTPKPGWAGTDVRQALIERFERPVAIDTDVNAAALAEARCGAGRGLRSLVYVTVGTGIGGGVVQDGRTLHGSTHPEMGHILVRRDPRDAGFAGVCPFHGDCLEGLASGTAIEARWGARLDALATSTDALDLIGGYLAQLVVSIALLTACERIVIGGGVMTHGALLPRIRNAASRFINGYLPVARADPTLEAYLVPPALGERSGIIGAALLAQRML